MSSSGPPRPPRSASLGEVACDYTLLRELGTRAPPTYAAKAPARIGGGVVVVERLKRTAGVSAEDTAAFVRDAKRLAQVRHPNVAGAKDVVVTNDEVVVATDLIDGATLADLVHAANERGQPVSLAVGLRILIDVLQGLSALHERLDAKGAAAGLLHGSVAPSNVVVGIDGTTRIIAVCRGPSTDLPAADAMGYLAPEVLLADASADARADVYGAGVMLWEMLAGTPMHTDLNAGAIVLRLLGGKIERPQLPADAPWADPLIDAAMRAIAPDPSARFPTAAALTGEVRRAAGTRLASKPAVAQTIDALCGARIRARRAALGASVSGSAPRASMSAPGVMSSLSSPPSPQSRPPRGDIPTPIVPAAMGEDAVEIVEIDLAPDPSERKIAKPVDDEPEPATRVYSLPEMLAAAGLQSIPGTKAASAPAVSSGPPRPLPSSSLRSALPGPPSVPSRQAPPVPSSKTAPPLAPTPSAPAVASFEEATLDEDDAPEAELLVSPPPPPLAHRPPVAIAPPHAASVASYAAVETGERDTPPPSPNRGSKKRVVAIGVAVVAIAAAAVFAMRPDAAGGPTGTPIAKVHRAVEITRTGSARVEHEASPAAGGAGAPNDPFGVDDVENAPPSAGAPTGAPPAPVQNPGATRPSDAPGANKPSKPRYDPMGI